MKFLLIDFRKILLLIFFSFFCSQLSANSPETFPVYNSIKPNIDFWMKVYTMHHTQQGLIHDADNLNIVYEVVDLKPQSERGSSRYNRNLLKQTKKKYSMMLEKFAKGQKPETPIESKVYELFGPDQDPLVLLEAMDNIRFQRGQSDRFKQGIIRSNQYLNKIKTIFKNHDLPEDLAYLPHVESSFNYNAYSKFGAAGIWQFTHGTGKRYMLIDYTVDERRDPILSAHAAAKFLKQNYEKLGSWALALTAYNHGVNSMLKAKKEKGDYETIINEYEGRRFKFASKNFYSEFLAAREIAKNHEKYFGELELSEPVSTIEIELPDFVSVSKVANHFRIDPKTIKLLNPALRDPVFKEQKYIPKGYRLKLPNSELMKELSLKMPSDMFEQKQKRSRFYYVQKGDVAGSIARQHGISLQDLIWANNLDYRATIYVGQNLRIPTTEDALQLALEHSEPVKVSLIEKPQTVASDRINSNGFPQVQVMDNGNFKLVKNINLSVVTGNLTVQRSFEKNNHVYGIIQVDTGETLGHYADWLNVSTQQIRMVNGRQYGKMIEFNDQIIIPLDKVNKEQFEEKRYEYHKEFEEDFLNAYKIESISIYEIKRGDNIWTLCQNIFDLPFWLIRKYNSELDFVNLKVMQKIIVPVVEKLEQEMDEADLLDEPFQSER
ncbi:transglycosylase SLT domain-containing protein [bacterium]|nr:transglycosylase SLT domain-containing protein [bacterium]